MRNILFCSDAFLQGGLESRIIDEIRFLKTTSSRTFLACHQLNQAFNDLFDDVVLLDDTYINNDDSIKTETILKNRDLIHDFCKTQSIDFIDCHPFFCILPATLAAQKSELPISFTIHGSSSGNFIGEDRIKTKLLFYLVLRYGFDALFAVSENLRDQYSFLSANINVARNALPSRAINTKQFSPTGRFVIASRLDYPKTKIIINFLKTIQHTSEVSSIDIIGDGDSRKKLTAFIAKNKLSKCHVIGWHDNLISKISNEDYEAGFGLGRVALDIINSGKPTGIVGNNGFVGFLNKDNLESFAKTNFTSWGKKETEPLSSSIKKLRENPKKYLFTQDELAFLDSETNWQSYFQTIKNCVFNQKQVISILNNILENEPNITNIDKITSELDKNFENRYDIIYHSYKNLVANEQRDITKLELELHSVKTELKKITSSKFWKTTKPIRDILNKMH